MNYNALCFRRQVPTILHSVLPSFTTIAIEVKISSGKLECICRITSSKFPDNSRPNLRRQSTAELKLTLFTSYLSI